MRTKAAGVLGVAMALAIVLLQPAAPVSATGALKPVITGVLDRKGLPSAAMVPGLDGFVVKANWADIQPQASGPIAANNAIDKAIAAVRALPPGANYHLKLRIEAGVYAPAWAKTLGGGPVNYYKGRQVLTFGRFWTPAFGAAYAELQSKLAAKYDVTPEIAETEISRCTVLDAEPFLRANRTDTRTMESMVAAGFTAAADEICHRDEVDAHQVWLQTRTGLALDPYDRIRPDGTVVIDEAFTEQMMGYCRTSLGARCVLENNGISSPLPSGSYPAMYAGIAASGPPIAFQTADPKRIGDWYATLVWAAGHGANHVELNIDYPTYDSTRLQSARAQLQANPTG